VVLIYGSAAAVLVLLFTSFFFSATFFGDRVSSAELERLQSENQALQEKFEQLRWNMAEVEDRYATVVESEIKLRTMFDLPSIDPQERLLGVGGPIPPAVATMSPAEKVAYGTENEVERLLRLSRFELDQYAEIEEELSGLKDRLDHTPSIWPTKGWLSRGYGIKGDPFTGYKRMHNGIDIANHKGTPIVATADGIVKSVGWSGGLGKIVAINHGYGFVTRYAHLSKASVSRGAKVSRGDVIGLMGSTGYSTGPHLHYEVIKHNKSKNPANFILNKM